MTIKTYKDCSEMPIFNFMMYISNFNLKWLISNINKHTDKEITSFIFENKPDLEIRIYEIEEEYKSLTFNKKELVKQKKLAKMMFLEMQYNAIIKVIDVYLSTQDVKVLKILNELNFKIDIDKPIEPQLEKAIRRSHGIQNKLNIQMANFKTMYKMTDKDIKDQQQPTRAGVEKSLDSQALVLEQNLETGYRIDIKKTRVLRWTNLMESNERKLIASQS